MTGINKTENGNSELAENGIVVTEAMIEVGVQLLDSWTSRWTTEMYLEGHSGFEKRELISHMLSLSNQ